MKSFFDAAPDVSKHVPMLIGSVSEEGNQMSSRPTVEAVGIKQVLSAPRSPWQRAYVERLIGSIRRECLDHIVVFEERSLRRTLSSYVRYYHSWRTHLSLGKDAPQPRRTQYPGEGQVFELPELGGLHHHHERRAA